MKPKELTSTRENHQMASASPYTPMYSSMLGNTPFFKLAVLYQCSAFPVQLY